MWWPFQWLVIYILGGFTCVPLIIALTIWYVMTYGSVPIGDDDPMKWVKHHRQRQHDAAIADTSSTKEQSTSDPTKRTFAGYLTVRRQFRPAATGASFLFGSSTDLSGAEVKEDETDETASLKDGKPSASLSVPIAPTVSQRLVGAYKQVRKTQAAPPKELFYCVLKGSVLFLYDDDKQAECVAAISIEKYNVGMEKREWADGRETGRSLPFDGKDGEMFAKRNACVMRLVEKESGKEKKGLPVVTKSMGDVDINATAREREHQEEMENAPWFFFSTRNTEMEDLYIALVQVSAAKPTITDVFSFEGMKQLVNTIDTEPDPLSTRWLNAFVGRIFLSLNQTRQIENKIIDKIKLKLTKVQRPAWLGEIIINEVHVGKTPPIFYRPMLKDLTPTGGAAMEIGLKYRTDPLDLDSGVRFIASTQAIIPLGYKQVTVNIMVEARLKTLEGNVLLKIKEPPTNRIWWGFTSQPKLDVEIRPVVQDRKLNLSVVLNQLDSLLRKVIAESVVLPAMDDIAFFDTKGQDVRGGIFSSASKYTSAPEESKADAPVEETIKAPEQLITSNEDPASATPETAGLRQRVPSKAKTLGPESDSLDKDKEEPVKSISRVDTAPAEIGAAVAPKRTSGFEKWFPPVPGLVPSLTGEKDATALASTPLPSKDKGINGSAAEPRPASMSAAPKLVIPDTNPSTSSRDRTPSPPQLIETPISLRSLPGTSGSVDTGSNPSLNSVIPSNNLPASSLSTATTAASASSSATLLSAVKQYRAGDKKALQDITKTGMDGVKKGWLNFAAKRKGLVSGEPPSPEHRPVKPVPPPYRPAEDDRDAAAGIAAGRTSISGDGLSRSVEGKSLKERLDAAAHHNAVGSGSTSTVSGMPTTRPRSGTESSRGSLTGKPSLLSSPSKSSVPTLSPTSTPHTDWTPVSRSGDNDHPAADPPRRESSGSVHSVKGKNQVQPVLIQPGIGRGMVVPRVPKRPGEVTGLGSSPGQGMVRKVSEGKEVLVDNMPGDAGDIAEIGASKPATSLSDVGDRSAGVDIAKQEFPNSASKENRAGPDETSSTSSEKGQSPGRSNGDDLASAIEIDQRMPPMSDKAPEPAPTKTTDDDSRPASIRQHRDQHDLASAIILHLHRS